MVPFVTYCSMRQRPSPLNYFVDRMAGNDATASPDCDATRSDRSSRPYCAPTILPEETWLITAASDILRQTGRRPPSRINAARSASSDAEKREGGLRHPRGVTSKRRHRVAFYFPFGCIRKRWARLTTPLITYVPLRRSPNNRR